LNTPVESVKIKVKRYLPENPPRSFYQEYEVKYHPKMFVLDALNYVRDRLDGSLAFRWSCRMGVCGSCGALVNGKPELTCAIPVPTTGKEVVIEPLHNFPVRKDLVVDLGEFFEKLGKIEPWIIRERARAIEEGEHLQKPSELEKYEQFSACINCMLCYAACPVFATDSDFIGPAAAALGYRYNLDSRDQGKKSRLNLLTEGAGAFDCTFVGECSIVCPKGVDPALALQRIKIDSTVSTLKSIMGSEE
jgi:fumarate reductase iron-sulfur subunit